MYEMRNKWQFKEKAVRFALSEGHLKLHVQYSTTQLANHESRNIP